MGFDPRHWSASSLPRESRERVTSNVQALLAENDALRREVQRLQRELDRMQRQQRHQSRHETPRHRVWQQPSASPPPLVTAEQVICWGEALAQQTGWSVLRLNGLEALIDQLNRSSFHSQLNLQQRLDRLVSGLGTDLQAAVGQTTTKKKAAVLAAFALFGVRASEWLDEDPRRVVLELRQRQQQATGSGRRTRSDQRRTDRQQADQQQSDQHHDPRTAALVVLGLQVGASQEAIKQAHRRLVKQHHPDMGGSAEAFRRVNEAYQLLLAHS